MVETRSVRHVHEALRQVRELQRRVLETARFTGYSGRARAASGAIALVAAAVMSRPFYPRTPEAHLVGWGVVLALAAGMSGWALLRWFLFSPEARRDPRRLVPTIDALPPLAVGGILSAALVSGGAYDWLFGTWMCLVGLANLSLRRVLPRAVWPLGLFYILCGTLCLFIPGVTFTDPWPMGLVFFFGEMAGGFIVHRTRLPEATLSGFLWRGDRPESGVAFLPRPEASDDI